MEELIHYYHPQSRGMRTHKLLQIFEVPHKEVIIDYTKGENKTEDYLKIHPLGRVPALKHGDLILTESGAITLYLADLFPEKMKTPRVGTPERGRLYEWILFLQTSMEQAMLPIYTGGDKGEITQKLYDQLAAMKGRFKGPYALGDEFTLLDVVISVDLAWYHLMQVMPELPSPFDEFAKRTFERMKWDSA